MLSKPVIPFAARLVALLAMAALASGCIGARQPAEIQEEAQRRGGGAEPFVVRAAATAVAAQLSVDPGSLVIASISMSPNHVILEVADPHLPGNWDRYRYANGRLDDPSPIRTGSDEPPGFRLEEFQALDRLPMLVADAMARSGFAEARIGSVRIRPERSRRRDDASMPGPRLQVQLNDPRRGSVSLQYDAQGRPL